MTTWLSEAEQRYDEALDEFEEACRRLEDAQCRYDIAEAAYLEARNVLNSRDIFGVSRMEVQNDQATT